MLPNMGYSISRNEVVIDRHSLKCIAKLDSEWMINSEWIVFRKVSDDDYYFPTISSEKETTLNTEWSSDATKAQELDVVETAVVLSWLRREYPTHTYQAHEHPIG